MKKIDKPKAGEYPAYAIMCIGLLSDDGLVLQHLQDNLKATKDFILSLPRKNSCIATPMASGRSRKCSFTSSMMSGFMRTVPCVCTQRCHGAARVRAG